MWKSVALMFVGGLCICTPGLCQVSLTIDPPLAIGNTGGTTNFRVLLTSDEPVFAAQFTIDYDNAVAGYKSVAMGSSLPSGFSILVNPDPSMGTNSPATNSSVLVQVFGGAESIAGSDLEIAVLTFDLASSVCDASPLTFDSSCSPHTHVVVNDDAICHPDLALKSGQLATTCATDVAPGATSALQLDQNRPNPFNPSTTISFSVPGAGHVRLVIVDVLGRAVRTLVDGELSSGRHEVSWHGRDSAGRLVPSGIYYYALKGDEGSQLRRMLLLK